LARRISTLDVLSGGRVEVGIGVGWSRDEFEAAGTPFERRGALADEFLRALIDLWTRDPIAFKGEFYSIPESMVGPKPVQKPHPPIYIAGFGDYTFKRAARFGSGWNPAGIMSFEALEASIKLLNEIAAREGRGPMEVVLRAFTVVFDQPSPNERRPAMGTLAEIREDIKRLRDAGVTCIVHSPPEIGFIESASVEMALIRMEQLMEISR
jgi:probable F420-dependent oxidoreductase